MDDGNSITTRLLTLLNVSAVAVKTGKRKRTYDDVSSPAVKLNKRKSAAAIPVLDQENVEVIDGGQAAEIVVQEAAADDKMETEEGTSDAYEQHFGVNPKVPFESYMDAIKRSLWKTSQEILGKLGPTFISIPEGADSISAKSAKLSILDRWRIPFQSRQAKQPRDETELQDDILSLLSSYYDLYLTSRPLDSSKYIQEALSLHLLNHITKKRNRILKNNERLSHAAKLTPNDPPPEDVQDQGFTRPSILILLPFRSFAYKWLDALTSHTPTPAFQVENHSRFVSEYGLPPGTIDKFTTVEPGTYPRDHIEMFQGNVDDNFRLGVKLTRKSLKLFTEFYSCDVIIASPLGLRMSIEKETADFLSSIEIVIVDQMDTLVMQNWEHVQFVFANLNKLPKESHNADFSRIKPWCLDGHAAYLRQTILLSAFETSETRLLFHRSLTNISGKIRSYRSWQPVVVPEGVDQNFVKFDCSNPEDEADKRFNYFTTQMLPAVLKSAVQSANTVIFVPSSFDFIRVHNYFRSHGGVTFTVLSEYSSNQEISRARQAFFDGKRSFLLVSERFHFYRRYKIRGIRNLVFYGLPDHPQFYTEFLSYPFLDDGVDASDVTCRALYSRYDWFRLERIAGTRSAAVMIKGS